METSNTGWETPTLKPTTCHGYVVVPLAEYNALRDQVAQAKIDAQQALSLSAQATLKAKKDLADTLNNLCMIERECLGNRNIVVHFNEKAMYDLAMQKLIKTFTEEELAVYDVFCSDDFIIGDITLCRRKHDAPEVF